MKKCCLVFVLAIILGAITTKEALALGADFSQQQLASAGKHAVHGFWVNEQIVVFFAADTDRLNRDLPRYLEGEYASRRVIIHAGTKRAESPWDAEPRETFADWSVNTWADPEDAAKAAPRMRMQIDIWLGSRIELKQLRIPDGFEVTSGGEIEQFIEQRKLKAK